MEPLLVRVYNSSPLSTVSPPVISTIADNHPLEFVAGRTAAKFHPKYNPYGGYYYLKDGVAYFGFTGDELIENVSKGESIEAANTLKELKHSLWVSSGFSMNKINNIIKGTPIDDDTSLVHHRIERF